MKPPKARIAGKKNLFTVFIVIVVLLAVLVVILDWHDVRLILSKADWQFTVVALAFTVLSYVCLSLSYAWLNRFFGINASWSTLSSVGFASSALNNVLAFMGAAGHSMRLVLIGRHNSRGEVLAASIFHSYLNNVVMLSILPISLFWLVVSKEVAGDTAVSLSLLSGFLFLLVLATTFVLFFVPLRTWLLRVIAKLWHFITRRDISKFLTDLGDGLTQGFARVKGRKLAIVLLLLVGDWGFAAAALYYCFRGLGGIIGWGALLSGFGFGIVAGNLSFIPGGLGIQEASMSGIYALLGTPFAVALLIAILFRVVYDFIPFFASLAFYQSLLRSRRQ